MVATLCCEEIANEKFSSFIANELVQLAYQSRLGYIRSGTLDGFKDAFDNALNGGKRFAMAVRDCSENFMPQFDKGFASVSGGLQAVTSSGKFEVWEAYVDLANWDSSKVREKLHRGIDVHVAAVRTAKLSELTTMYETRLQLFYYP
ncbi:Protein ROOT HAIR DEFECTIVE 3 [Forsythia ovata]|uniref:Protein ROOT HAIR DEFECTIVE 3 n=1 Tax=Forsythia ovata TaxID=205694 RepID=A0ABD1S2X2_9LAMI